jgi:hypothetical protein
MRWCNEEPIVLNCQSSGASRLTCSTCGCGPWARVAGKDHGALHKVGNRVKTVNSKKGRQKWQL